MTTEEITTKQEEQRERALNVLRRLVDEKREDERRTIEAFKNDPDKRAFVAELYRRNVECGTPPTHYAFELYKAK